VFIVSSPRSGSTLLFETLQRAPGLYTIGGESHQLIESIPALSISAHNLDSNRLLAEHATPDVARTLRERFYAALRDREGRPPPTAPVRMLEKTPKNSLRIPFLAKVFPEAHFICLLRDPRQVLSSMLEAWRSGRFRTYPGLPGWPPIQPPWSLLLTPGWRGLANKPLPEIVAAQWAACVNVMLDDLARLPADRVSVTRYEALTRSWGPEVSRLCDRVGLDWDGPLTGPLPFSRYTVSAPSADKWRAHAHEIEPVMGPIQATIERVSITADG